MWEQRDADPARDKSKPKMIEQDNRQNLWLGTCNVSVYRNVNDNTGVGTCDIWDWLDAETPVVRGDTAVAIDRHLLVGAVRREPDKDRQDALKRCLPLATMAGTFDTRQRGGKMLTSTGLVCLDMDGKDNEHIGETTWWEIAHVLRVSGHCAYFGWSVRKGYFALIAIDYPTDSVPDDYADKYKRAYRYLSEVFKTRWGVVCDKQCCNVNRLRCLSEDHLAWTRYDLTPIDERLYAPAPPSPVAARRMSAVRQKGAERIGVDDDYTQASDAVSYLCGRGVNVTQIYGDWWRLCLSTAALGEMGRELCHRLSAMDSRYTAAETDRKFTDAVTNGRGEVTIKTLFKAARDNGWRWSPGGRRFRR